MKLYFFMAASITFFCLTIGQPSIAQEQVSCAADLESGGRFLHGRNSTLHTQPFIEHRAQQIRKKSGKALNQPADKILAWIEHLEIGYARGLKNSEFLDRLMAQYHKMYLTPADQVPESFFALEARIAREQGLGSLELTPKEREEKASEALDHQRKTLDRWLNYFFSTDSASYPMWIKYWSFTGMVKLGKYNPETATFENRSRGSMAPFPELNPEALSQVVGIILKKIGGKSLEDIKDPALLKALENANFGNLYGRALQIATAKTADLDSLEGRWVTYPRGSDPTALVNSLEGRNTGWCTAGESVARSQLANGDFHVYYSNDRRGAPVVPRIAIRMNGYQIGEIRGIGKGQNLDAKISTSDLLKNKLSEFGERGLVYEKRSRHMKRLTEIENRQLKSETLSHEDLRFLYQIDEKILGFGQTEDPRIEEIVSRRHKRRDISEILNLQESEISFTQDEALRDGIRIHVGDLSLKHTTASGLMLPDWVTGSVLLNHLEAATGLILPKKIGGGLNLQSLTSGRGLVFPEGFSVVENLSLHGLGSTADLHFPTKIDVGGRIYLINYQGVRENDLPASLRDKIQWIRLK